jgi:hypothetical protein
MTIPAAKIEKMAESERHRDREIADVEGIPDVPLDIGVVIVSEPFPRVEVLIVDPRVQPLEQDLFEGHVRRPFG